MKKTLAILFFLFAAISFSQTICTSFNPTNFVLNGNAAVTNSPEVTLTNDQGNLYGTMWSNQEILFDEDFLIQSELFFGFNDWGADGIAFVLQPQSSNAGGAGGGIGYADITPSLAIEFDTYFNTGSDPITNDHVAIIKNGQPYSIGLHSEFITPVDIGNVENGQWHTATFEWTASTQKLKLIFDGIQLFDVTIDLATIFPSNNSVFWGFTSATGGANNLHKVKINNYCVTLDPIIPQIVINSNLNYCDSNSCEIIAPTISISESNTIISGAKVYFTSNYVTGEDVLSFTPNFGITGSFDPLTGVLSLNGSTSIANYEQVLESVCYQNSAVNPTPGNRVVTYVIGDLLYNATNQHFYKLITSLTPIQWTEATTNASNTNYFGLPGYLVTITDQQENDFINSLINSNSWLGATDTNIEGEWRWVTGCEGQENSGLGRLFSLQQLNAIGISVNSNYINWACVEPNNCCGGENYLHMIGPNTILCGNFGEWNDYPNSGIPYTGAPPVTNYIIEYGCSNNSVYSNLSASVVITVENETIPTFTQIADICPGGLLPILSNISTNGITGTWSPALNNTATTTYTFTPNTGQCATTTTMTINVVSNISPPTGNSLQVFCANPVATVNQLSATGNNIQWYAVSTGGTPLASSTILVNGTTYYASQTENGCESNTRLEVTVNINDPQITASANSICIGENVNLTVNYSNASLCNMNITPNAIPLGNPIPGFTYGGTFNGHYYYIYNTPTTWTAGELICRQNGGYLVCINDINENTFVSNLTNNNIWIGMFRDPTTCQFRWLDCMNITFTNWRPGEPNSGPCGEPYVQIIRGCSFGLNTWNNLSDNASNGACYSNMVPIMEIDPFYYNPTSVSLLWSTGETTPTINPTPTQTTNYWVDVTFGGVTCRKYMTITVNPFVTPTFTQVAAICNGSTMNALPTTSVNGITGTWSPALDNTATTTYTFTPTVGQCASTTSMTITVNPNITPTFTQVPAICSGATLSALPSTSNNGIIGTWSPALDNTSTTLYTFTPNAGQCATTATMIITVNTLPVVPTGNPQQNFCAIDAPTINNLVINSSFTNWYLTSTGGTALPLSYVLIDGLVLYAASYDPITLCEHPTRFPVTIMVENPLLPSIQLQQEICKEKNITLGEINTNGVTMIWYDNAISGNVIPLTHVIQNGDIFYGAALNTISGCESTTRIPLEVTVFNSNLSFYNLISIDDNELNKELTIIGLEQFPNNSIEIFNRYGDLVWSGINYDNSTNTFKGMANVSGVVSVGSYLPSGTYFFILSYPNECEKSELKGFIHIDNKL